MLHDKVCPPEPRFFTKIHKFMKLYNHFMNLNSRNEFQFNKHCMTAFNEVLFKKLETRTTNFSLFFLITG